MYQFKIIFLVTMCIGFSLNLSAERAIFKSFKEVETENQIAAERKAGFADIEIDNLHESIAASIRGIKKFVELGVDKQSTLYLPDIPGTEVKIFKQDKDGKTYIEFNLPQGQSFVDLPKVYIYNGVGFIYPSEDFTKIDKIVLMFRRVNTNDLVFIREMRRLINPSPNFSKKRDDGGYEIDSNSDLILEYYQSFTSNTIWPNNPHQSNEADVTMQLNFEGNPLPYEKQKLIIRQYKKILRDVDKDMAYKQRGLELDQRRMVSKMLEFR